MYFCTPYDSLLSINGGYIVVNASGGDGLGCNGDVHITGGTYSGGTFRKTFTISNKITNVNF